MRGPVPILRPAFFAALLLAALSARARADLTRPELSGAVGRTLAVTGAPAEGGLSFAFAALWPVQERLHFGVGLFADDMGSRLGRLSDPNDGTDLGVVALDHRSTVGAAWRLDAVLPSLRAWVPYASGSWGIYHVADDHRGSDAGSIGSTGFSLGGGLRHPFAGRLSLGASVRYHRLFNDRTGRFVTAGVDWGWR
jgi:hypothetical protein